jgi:hypothetical protein
VLFAIVYAKILEEHPAVANLELIERTVREPDEGGRIHVPTGSGSSAERAISGFSPGGIWRDACDHRYRVLG